MKTLTEKQAELELNHVKEWQGLSIEEIRQRENLSRTKITYLLNKYGIKIPKRSNAVYAYRSLNWKGKTAKEIALLENLNPHNVRVYAKNHNIKLKDARKYKLRGVEGLKDL